jgi:hypothetical protein
MPARTRTRFPTTPAGGTDRSCTVNGLATRGTSCGEGAEFVGVPCVDGAYIPEDRRRALADDAALPLLARGSALFVDISGSTALTETLARELGGVDRGEAAWLTRRQVEDDLHLMPARVTSLQVTDGRLLTDAPCGDRLEGSACGLSPGSRACMLCSHPRVVAQSATPANAVLGYPSFP